MRPALNELIPLVAASGSIELASARIQKQSRMDETMADIDEDEAIELSCLAACALIASAPAVLQYSFSHACQYHVYREIYDASMSRGDLRTALSAQAEISKLIASVS